VRRQQGSGVLLLAIGAGYLGVGWEGVVAAALFPAVAVAAYGMVVLAARFRLPVGLVGPAVVAAAAVGSTVLAVSRTGTGLLATARDLVPRLLSQPYPAPATVDLLAPGVVLVAALAVGCAVRGGRPRGGRLVALVAVAVLYLATAVLSGGRADRHGLVGAVLLAAVVADWLLDEVSRPKGADAPDEPSGQAAVSAALGLGARRAMPLLGLFAAAVAVTVYVPGNDAFEPRLVVSRPTRLLTEPNPLPRIAVWNRDAGALLLRVRGEQQTRLRLVALDEYTGDGWRAGGDYVRFGSDVLDPDEAPLPPGRNRATVDVEVTLVADLGGHWLPTPGLPMALSLADAQVQPAAGVLARLEVSPAGLRYRVRSDVDAPVPSDLRSAAVPKVARYLDLPRLPSAFAGLARQTVRGASTPFDRAARIEAAVRAGRKFSPVAPAGSSYARLAQFLAGKDATGTAEQFASAFAVLARAVGLPARVVAGFLPTERDENGYWLVRGRDAFAWPEVYFTGLGWVCFDPRPQGVPAGGVPTR
jgi:Transglutaminase-like superfamily